jgi:predicted nucleic acid-binding protein
MTAGRPRALIDTSVFIAFESGRPMDLDSLPEGSTASVITLAELTVGVLAAGEIGTRSRRLTTIARLRSMELLPVTEAVAGHWARMRVQLAEQHRRVNVNDLWIAATAAAHRLPVVTQEADFDVLAAIGGIGIIRV